MLLELVLRQRARTSNAFERRSKIAYCRALKIDKFQTKLQSVNITSAHADLNSGQCQRIGYVVAITLPFTINDIQTSCNYYSKNYYSTHAKPQHSAST